MEKSKEGVDEDLLNANICWLVTDNMKALLAKSQKAKQSRGSNSAVLKFIEKELKAQKLVVVSQDQNTSYDHYLALIGTKNDVLLVEHLKDQCNFYQLFSIDEFMDIYKDIVEGKTEDTFYNILRVRAIRAESYDRKNLTPEVVYKYINQKAPKSPRFIEIQESNKRLKVPKPLPKVPAKTIQAINAANATKRIRLLDPVTKKPLTFAESIVQEVPKIPKSQKKEFKDFVKLLKEVEPTSASENDLETIETFLNPRERKAAMNMATQALDMRNIDELKTETTLMDLYEFYDLPTVFEREPKSKSKSSRVSTPRSMSRVEILSQGKESDIDEEETSDAESFDYTQDERLVPERIIPKRINNPSLDLTKAPKEIDYSGVKKATELPRSSRSKPQEAIRLDIRQGQGRTANRLPAIKVDLTTDTTTTQGSGFRRGLRFR